jgi:hypothetical protein
MRFRLYIRSNMHVTTFISYNHSCSHTSTLIYAIWIYASKGAVSFLDWTPTVADMNQPREGDEYSAVHELAGQISYELRVVITLEWPTRSMASETREPNHTGSSLTNSRTDHVRGEGPPPVAVQPSGVPTAHARGGRPAGMEGDTWTWERTAGQRAPGGPSCSIVAAELPRWGSEADGVAVAPPPARALAPCPCMAPRPIGAGGGGARTHALGRDRVDDHRPAAPRGRIRAAAICPDRPAGLSIRSTLDGGTATTSVLRLVGRTARVGLQLNIQGRQQDTVVFAVRFHSGWLTSGKRAFSTGSRGPFVPKKNRYKRFGTKGPPSLVPVHYKSVLKGPPRWLPGECRLGTFGIGL